MLLGMCLYFESRDEWWSQYKDATRCAFGGCSVAIMFQLIYMSFLQLCNSAATAVWRYSAILVMRKWYFRLVYFSLLMAYIIEIAVSPGSGHRLLPIKQKQVFILYRGKSYRNKLTILNHSAVTDFAQILIVTDARSALRYRTNVHCFVSLRYLNIPSHYVTTHIVRK